MRVVFEDIIGPRLPVRGWIRVERSARPERDSQAGRGERLLRSAQVLQGVRVPRACARSERGSLLHLLQAGSRQELRRFEKAGCLRLGQSISGAALRSATHLAYMPATLRKDAVRDRLVT